RPGRAARLRRRLLRARHRQGVLLRTDHAGQRGRSVSRQARRASQMSVRILPTVALACALTAAPLAAGAEHAHDKPGAAPAHEEKTPAKVATASHGSETPHGTSAAKPEPKIEMAHGAPPAVKASESKAEPSHGSPAPHSSDSKPALSHAVTSPGHSELKGE